MILLLKFQAKQMTFGCITAKSYMAVMYSHSMIHQCFTCISFKNHSISFIFWESVLVDFRQIVIFKKNLTRCKKVVKKITTFWVYH